MDERILTDEEKLVMQYIRSHRKCTADDLLDDLSLNDETRKMYADAVYALIWHRDIIRDSYNGSLTVNGET